jgi:DNA invertase Pin-like site-specific DNA recombinase
MNVQLKSLRGANGGGKRQRGQDGGAAPLCISYLRFSTPQQSEGDSTRRQLAASAEWAKARGLKIDDSYRDEGVSAYRGKNAASGALGRLLRLIESGAIPKGSVLIVESLDRLSRSEITLALQQFLGIINNGVRIVTLSDGREYSNDGDKPLEFSELIISISVMARANDESRIKGMRMRASWEQTRERAARGEVVRNWTPRWLKVRDGKVVVVAEYAAIVRRIFALITDGYGIGAVARLLNREKVASFGTSGRWSKTYVHQIVSGRAVLGELVQRKGGVVVGTVEGYYPPVVSVKQWDEANAVLAQRRNDSPETFKGTRGPKAAWVNLFNGLLVDDEGESWTIHQNASGDRRLVNNSGETLGTKPRTYVNLAVFEHVMFNALLKYHAEHFAPREVKADGDNLRAQIAEVDARLAEIGEAMAEGGNVKTLAKAAAALESKRERLEREYNASKARALVSDKGRATKLIERLEQVLSDEPSYAAREEMAATLRLIVKRIVMTAERTSTLPFTIEGTATVELFIGEAFQVRFAYRARRNAASGSPLATLSYNIFGENFGQAAPLTKPKRTAAELERWYAASGKAYEAAQAAKRAKGRRR